MERADEDLDIEDQLTDMDICGGWSDGDRLVLRACVGLVKTADAALRKVTKSMTTNGKSDTAEVTAEMDGLVELIETVSPAVDDLVSSLYPPVSLATIQTQVTTTTTTTTTTPYYYYTVLLLLDYYYNDTHANSTTTANSLVELIENVEFNNRICIAQVCRMTSEAKM